MRRRDILSAGRSLRKSLKSFWRKRARSLPDLGNRSENSYGRGQILSILQVNSCSIGQESGEIWTVQTDLQQIYPKSERLLEVDYHRTPLILGIAGALA